MGKPKLKLGDVLEGRLPHGSYYLHFIGTHHRYGQCATVAPAVHEKRPPITADLFASGYVVFYAASVLLRDGLLSVVGWLPPPPVPRRLRGPGVGSQRAWYIEEEDGTETRKEQLTEEERRLPVASIIGHPILVEQITTGWRPEHWRPEWWDEVQPWERANAQHEGDETLDEVSPKQGPRPLRHFLYFKRKTDAEVAARDLRDLGYGTELEHYPDFDWLVLATHSPVDPNIASLSETMEDVAHRHGGTYDGWEIEVGSVT